MSAADKAAPQAWVLARVLEFQRRTVELVAEEMWKIEHGWVARTPSLPLVWALNQVHVETPIAYEQAVELCAQHLSDADFEQLYIDREPAALRLEDTFRAEGWEVDVEVHLELVGEADRPAATAAVIEPHEAEALALMERWLREDQTLHLTADGLRQLVESNRLMWRARRARRLGIRDANGSLAGITVLFSDGTVGQVEDVYVIPEERGRGYGRALVSAAVELARAAGHEVTFIVADDNDWPKNLYRRVGFEPIGRTWLLHRTQSASSA